MKHILTAAALFAATAAQAGPALDRFTEYAEGQATIVKIECGENRECTRKTYYELCQRLTDSIKKYYEIPVSKEDWLMRDLISEMSLEQDGLMLVGIDGLARIYYYGCTKSLENNLEELTFGIQGKE